MPSRAGRLVGSRQAFRRCCPQRATQGERVRQRVGLARDVGLDAMRQRVDSDRSGECLGHGERELVVDNGGARKQGCAEHHHLHVARGVGDNGHLGDLAAGAGGSGDCDHRKTGMGDFVQPPILRQWLGIGGPDRDDFRCIDGGAPADSHDDVGPLGAESLDSRCHVSIGGIGLNLVEDGYRQAGARQRVAQLQRCAEFDDSGIRDDKNTRAAQFAD